MIIGYSLPVGRGVTFVKLRPGLNGRRFQRADQIRRVNYHVTAVEPNNPGIERNKDWRRRSNACLVKLSLFNRIIQVFHADLKSNQRPNRFVRSDVVNRNSVQSIYQTLTWPAEIGNSEINGVESFLGEEAEALIGMFRGRLRDIAVRLVFAPSGVVVTENDSLDRVATLSSADMKRNSNRYDSADCLRPCGPRGRVHSDPTMHFDHSRDQQVGYVHGAYREE